MTQIGFPLDKAHEALDAFLNREGDGSDAGRLTERWFGDLDKAEPLAYIIPADRLEELDNGHRQWLESQEVELKDFDDLPPGYRPWIHSPLATTERMLPTEPMHEPLAHLLFGKKHAELDQKGQDRVTYTAISLLLRVTLDKDGQGAVPVLCAGHSADEPGYGMRWQIAYVTAVPGLFTRVTGNGFLGEEWGVLTGSGWIIRGGFFSREAATAAIEALGRVLPNCDWMRLTPDAYTPAAKKAIYAVLRRYQQWGEDDKQPEPEVMPDPFPADGDREEAPTASE